MPGKPLPLRRTVALAGQDGAAPVTVESERGHALGASIAFVRRTSALRLSRTARGHSQTRRSAQPVYPLAVSQTLHPLFRVLFNFPSRYLFAIGLAQVLSLRWSLPPTLGCTAKQPDSRVEASGEARRRQGPGTRSGKATLEKTRPSRSLPLNPDPNATAPRGHGPRGFSAGLFPLHSPLLRESLLVSSPPLTEML